MHKVFISYHHNIDQIYKDKLVDINRQQQIFIDLSLYTGDTDDYLPDSRIR